MQEEGCRRCRRICGGGEEEAESFRVTCPVLEVATSRIHLGRCEAFIHFQLKSSVRMKVDDKKGKPTPRNIKLSPSHAYDYLHL